MSKQKSILIIDDDIGIRDGLSVLLGKYFIIGTASSGEEALEIIKSSDYDIYIIDIFLGDLSGFDILKEIKKNKPNARTIMLTGFGSDEDIELAKKLGADEFLHKPITFSRLKNVIDNINNNKTNYTKVSPISLSLHKVIRNSNLEILKASNNINQVIKVLADECPDNENRLKEINKFNAIVKLTVIFIDYYILYKNKNFEDQKSEINLKEYVTNSVKRIGDSDIIIRVMVDDKRVYTFSKSFQLLNDILLSLLNKYDKSILRIKKETNAIEIELLNTGLNIQHSLEKEEIEESFPSLEIMLLKEVVYYLNARFNIKQEGPYTNLKIQIPFI